MRILTWREFDCCVKAISNLYLDVDFSGVYGFPRGGLCLAVATSHALSIPLLDTPQENSLVLDDIYETGFTLNTIKNLDNFTAFVWVSKVEPDWWQAFEIVDSKEWIVFPWENRKSAAEEMVIYRESRALLSD